MLKDFYLSFSAVCFTLLGFWLIVVQTRHAEWRGSPLHRRRVYAVALHFSLPGVMSLLALAFLRVRWTAYAAASSVPPLTPSCGEATQRQLIPEAARSRPSPM